MILQSFTIIIEKDDPHGWHAYVPELSGCHSFGDTPEEAKENISEAIWVYVSEKKEQKEKIPHKTRIVDHMTLAIPN